MSLDRALEFLAGGRAIFGGEVVHSDGFRTEKVREREIRPKKMIGVHPSGTSETTPWSFKSLFTFLNEFPPDWVKLRNRSHKLPPKPDRRQLSIYYADGNGKGNRRMIVTNATNWTISVQISPRLR
jgi:hypothetical protein